MKTCLIIPVFNHENAIIGVIEKLKAFELPCFLVNDGSTVACSQVLADCADKESSWLTLITRQENGGKGAAVIDGFNAAIMQGFNYAIQIDSDDQHDTNAIPEFLAASQQHPEAMILGQPIFDASVPKNRLYGRQVTNFWIAINTLSFAIADGMCGFRLYPLTAVNRLISNTSIGQRMDFDIDIVVRLYWQGVNVVNLPTAVRYPIDGVSHFKLWRDNLMISLTHARLFFGMLIRIPQLLFRHWR
ncbi:MAG: glycosyltransferase family 2 protein [Methyloglobulus sp.]|nr:glycosyltransferase family 2 protein [Methyloglobulus sp.]